MAYSLDSSGILDLFRYYPPDVFPTIWVQMDAAARSGIVFAADEVYRELEKKDDVAFEWLKARRTIVVALDTEIQQRVAAILAVHPRLIDTRRNRSSGDPFVIALAQSRGFSVVTGEKASGVLAKPNIPDVCEAIRIPWMNVLAMFRKGVEGLIQSLGIKSVNLPALQLPPCALSLPSAINNEPRAVCG